MVVGTFANADVKGLLIMGPDLFFADMARSLQ